nr:MAG TPA: hypothetical protein [Caudoviricetes sp.]
MEGGACRGGSTLQKTPPLCIAAPEKISPVGFRRFAIRIRLFDPERAFSFHFAGSRGQI